MAVLVPPCFPSLALTKLERVADHFVFSIESTGVVPPERILRDAIEVLRAKCATFVEELRVAEVAERAQRDGAAPAMDTAI